MSCDFELGRNVSCEESTVSPAWANLLQLESQLRCGGGLWWHVVGLVGGMAQR